MKPETRIEMITEWTEASPLRERLERQAARRKAYAKEYFAKNKTEIMAKKRAGKRAWYAANRERLIKESRERYQANPEKMAAVKRDWCHRNKDKVAKSLKKYHVAHREKNCLRLREYYRLNKERFSEINRTYRAARRGEAALYLWKWREANKIKVIGYRVRRKADVRKATPGWLTAEQQVEIDVFYETALVKPNAGKHEVDHIVPLRGKNVCGLHVPWNLQVITAEANHRKNNRVPDELHRIWWGASGYDKVRAEKPGIVKLLWNE
jgi:5-methylcytosine-specific restriction endonuclease McrA